MDSSHATGQPATRILSAALIIIGDEILSGKFADENGPYLIKKLREIGISLRRVAIISDDLDEIAEEVRRAAGRYDLVFTSGGVGPTHDDLTLPGVAQAFGVGLEDRAELVEAITTHMGGSVTEAALRMARLPVGARLVWGEGLRYPLVIVQNVHVLPGVPSIFRRKLDAALAALPRCPVSCARVMTDEAEVHIAARLEEAVAAWPSVSIGSYPRYDEGPHFVIITMEGHDAGAVEDCRAFLAARLRPRGA